MKGETYQEPGYSSNGVIRYVEYIEYQKDNYCGKFLKGFEDILNSVGLTPNYISKHIKLWKSHL